MDFCTSILNLNHGFKLHLPCNDCGEIMTFCLTRANVDDRDARVWDVFSKELHGKVFADRGYIRRALFEELFDRGIHLVHGLKANMRNRLMPIRDKTIPRKRYIIECINELLWEQSQSRALAPPSGTQLKTDKRLENRRMLTVHTTM